MKIILYTLLISFLVIISCNADDPVKDKSIAVEGNNDLKVQPKKPFPTNVNFLNCIKPNHLTQDELNSALSEYYDNWKWRYVRQSNGVTPGGGYYVKMQGTGGDGNEITTSEAHGYGMIIFSLMAGYDEEAKQYFDGFFNMFDKHRSTSNPYLMSWVIHKSEKASYDKGSATDGDLDIAYALLLAHKQWGSEGEINYLSHAIDIINLGIKKADMSIQTNRVLLGDWDKNHYSTRSSDWMAGHFRAFHKVTNDGFWLDAADTIYDLIQSLTHNYSFETGLMPDFVVGDTPKPAPEYYLDEFKDTDEYNWNACRYPWRITCDYAHNGSVEARKAMIKLMDFIVGQTDGNPDQIKAGYYLNGKPLRTYSSGAFTGPLVSAAITDAKYQDYLNKGWDQIIQIQEGYYSDTLCLLNMLLITGNWWAPE